jgi:hypothetical protein
MSREVRMVPPNWQHPTEWRKNWSGKAVLQFRPLFGGDYAARVARWDEKATQWEKGFVDDWKGGWRPKTDDEMTGGSYAECNGERPLEEDYMPIFEPGSATHLMMYETTTEGSPISPAFATPEELAQWLADNKASAFGGDGATYEQWLSVCRGGWAPSAVIVNGVITSGVAGVRCLMTTLHILNKPMRKPHEP